MISDIARQLVRRRIEMAMVDTVSIRRAGLGVLDPVTLAISADGGAIVYPEAANNAHVGRVSPTGDISTGEGEIAMHQVTVTIKSTGTFVVRNDDLVTVVTTTDGLLDGSVWRVIGLDGGGLFNEACNLTCSGVAPSRYWTGEATDVPPVGGTP